MNQSIRRICLTATATAACGLLLSPASAQTTATTDPVGAMTVTLEAFDGTAKGTNFVSIPLLPAEADISGVKVGVITSVGPSSITVSNAGWTPGELSNESNPYLAKIMTGLNEGLVLPIKTSPGSENTAETIYVDTSVGFVSFDLTTLDIQTGVNGDEIQLFSAPTLLSVFGTPTTTGIAGGTSFADADTILVFDGIWRNYFYNSTREEWVQSTFGFPSADNLVLHPYSAVLFERFADTDLELMVSGRVPMTPRLVPFASGGVTTLSNGWPVGTTLEQLGLEDLPGWISGGSALNADSVLIKSGNGPWRIYFYDGSDWRESTFGFPLANQTALPAGGGVLVDRNGQADFVDLLDQSLPY